MWEVSIHREIPWGDLSQIENSSIEAVQADNQRAFLIVSEPLPTFTHGLSANQEDLLWNEQTRLDHGASVFAAPRGGKWTYHGPGQIVIFPVVSLERVGFRPREVRKFIETIRESLIAGLKELNINAYGKDDPYGIYVDEKKLASFGFGFERGIAKHGVAIYYSSQQKYLSGINPCGYSDVPYVSLRELGVDLSYEKAALHCVQSIKSGFQPLSR